jgi:protocatechuate 3,4-dioxygenase beta subunit
VARRRLDDLWGSWPALTALACIATILFLGLGSERVRRVVRDTLPAALGGGPTRTGSYWDEQNAKNPPPEEKKEEDPDALPSVPKEDSLRGIVKDSTGRPIAGATISAERWRESRWEVLGTARTNKDGEFVLGPVPRAQISACARAEGFASDRKQANTGSRLEFVLKKGGNLALKVVDAVTGEPIVDCYLSGYSGSGDWWETARTDKDGKYRFSSVPPGRIWLNVHPALHRETNLNDLEVFEGKETFKEIPVVKGGMLKGRVIDRETKGPVAGAKIRTWEGVKQAVAGPDGRYELPSPTTGWMSMKAECPPDYPEQWTYVQLSGDPSQDFERDIEISRGCKVSGAVVKPDGTPAAGARVGRDPGELLTGVPEHATTADAEGNFTLEAVPAWNGMRLFAVAEGFGLSRSDALSLRPGVEIGGIRILLQTGATYRGTVKDEEGEPLSGVSFTFQRMWDRSEGGGWYWIPGQVAYSVADGTWEIAGLPQAKYQLKVHLEGYAPETRSNLQAPAEGEVDGQDFVLRKGSVITGRVRDREGKAVAGVSVTAWGWVQGSEGRMEWVQRSEVRSDEEGLFILDGLRDGSYQLQITCPGYAQQDMPGIAAGTREIPVTLLPMAKLEGRVFEADGVTPVPTFNLKVYMEVDGDGNPQDPGNQIREQDFADREGKFSLQDVPAGQFAITATSGNRVSLRLGGIVVGAGTIVTDLRLSVVLGGKLRVLVRDLLGTPLHNAQVNAARRLPDGNYVYEYWAQTDKEGVASFAAMADGTWTIFADYSGRVQANGVVNVGGGVEAEMELVMRVGGSVLVHARDAKGAAVEGALVRFFEVGTGNELQPDWGRIWQRAWERTGGRNVDWNQIQREATHTNAEGRLLRESLKPGKVRVVLAREGFRPAEGTADVDDGYEIDLSLTLEVPDGGAAGANPDPAGGGGDDEGAYK